MASGTRVLLQYCDLGITTSWEKAPPGARASRPHKSWYSLTHLLDPDRTAAAQGSASAGTMRFPLAVWPGAASQGN